MARAVSSVARLERLAGPRLASMTGPIGARGVGFVVLVLLAIVTLAIPMPGVMPPAIATIVIAVGVIQPDGLPILFRLAPSAAVLAVGGMLAIEAIGWVATGLA